MEFHLWFAVRCVLVSVWAVILIDFGQKLSILLHSLINFHFRKSFFNWWISITFKNITGITPLNFIFCVLHQEGTLHVIQNKIIPWWLSKVERRFEIVLCWKCRLFVQNKLKVSLYSYRCNIKFINQKCLICRESNFWKFQAHAPNIHEECDWNKKN